MAIMREAKWVRGKTARELASRWAMPLATVEGYSSEAWRRLAAEENPAEVRVLVSETLRSVIADAMAETRDPALLESDGKGGKRRVYPESPNGARRVVVDAAKVLVALVGAAEPQEVRIIGDGEPLTREERLAGLAAMRREIQEEEDALRGSDDEH